MNTLRHRVLTVVAVLGAGLLAGVLLCPYAQAATPLINYPNFANATELQLQLNGSSVLTGSALELTPAEANFQHGSAFSTTEISTTASFETTFELYIHNSTTSQPADGVAFVLQPNSDTALGSAGSDMGYGGITPSAEVQFDVYQDFDDNDPSVPYVSFMEDGNNMDHLATSEAPLKFPVYDEHVWAWINYNAETHTIAVYASNSDSKPTEPLFTYSVDLAELLGGEHTYVGFTGATGASDAVQEVLSWQLEAPGTPTGEETNPTNPTSGESCSTPPGTATLSDLYDLICGFVGDENEIVTHQGVLLAAVALLPHAQHIKGNIWTASAVVSIPANGANAVPSALQLIKTAALASIEDAVTEMVRDGLAVAFPPLAEDLTELGDVAEEDRKVAEEDAAAAQEMEDALNGSRATTSAEITGHILRADQALTKKLEALTELLDELEKAGAQLQLNLASDTRQLTTDSSDLASEINSNISSSLHNDYSLIPCPQQANCGAAAIFDPADATLTNQGVGTDLWSDEPASSVFQPPSLSPLAISASNLATGNIVNISGDGYAPASIVNIYSGSNPVLLTKTHTSTMGHLSAAVRISANVAPGAHELYAVGTGSRGDVKVTGASITVKTTVPPTIGDVRQTHRRWREGRRDATISAHRRRLLVGTTFAFTLNEQARVVLSFIQSKREAKCPQETGRKKHGHRCIRLVTRGRLAFSGRGGVNRVHFQGWLSKQQALRPGAYLLVIRAMNKYGRAHPKMLSFRIG